MPPTSTSHTASGIDARSWPRRHPVWTTVAALLVAVVLLLAFFNWNWLRRPIEKAVAASTGRELRLQGDLDVRWGFPPTLIANDLHFSNAEWSKQPEMASIRHLELRLRLLPLLAGKVIIPSLVLDTPRLQIERDAKGRGNWVFEDEPEAAAGDDGSALRIQRLSVSSGRLTFLEPTFKTELVLDFRTAADNPRSDALAPLLLEGKGSYRAAPFALKGQVDSPLDLQSQAHPYRIDLHASAGATRAHVSGSLSDPLQVENVSVNFELEGDDLAHLYTLVGVALPTTPPYHLKGVLSRKGSTYSYHDFGGKVGDSDLAGDADIDIGGARPKLTAKLTSKQLDFDDLAGFIGGTPAAGDGETASPQQVAQAAEKKASGRMLPSSPFHLEKLRAMDADVTLNAAHIDAPKLPLDAMSAHLLLHDGVLKLAPLDFTAAGGHLKTQVTLNARTEPIRTALDIDVRGLELPKLFPNVKSLQESFGTIAGVVKLEGSGNSTADMMATSSGEVSLIMGAGRMSNLLLELAGLDIAEALKFLLGKDRQVNLRCAYADFGVADGLATARALAFDTTDTALLGRGSINLKDETLNLTLMPRPKDFSPITLRSPLKIRGTFADPSFAPDAGPLLLRGAAVAALISLAPPAGLLGLIETGPGKDTDCGRNTAAGKPVPDPKPAPRDQGAAKSGRS